jgi:hypothetical protein
MRSDSYAYLTESTILIMTVQKIDSILGKIHAKRGGVSIIYRRPQRFQNKRISQYRKDLKPLEIFTLLFMTVN